MPSLKRQEGFLLSDNRASGGSLVERATITCHHCQRIVVLNPDRTRARGYCPKCNGYICDGVQCQEHKASMAEVFDRLLNDAVKMIGRG